MTPHLGIIRVLTTSDPTTLYSHEHLIRKLFPHWEITSLCIPDQPLGVYDAETDALAAAKVVQLADHMQSLGTDCILVSCMADPGVDAARKHLRVPVIGAGTAAAAVAASLGGQVGVISITDAAPEPVKRVLKGSLYKSVRPEGVHTTLHLTKPVGRKAAVMSAKQLAKEGADVILLGCTGMSTIGLAQSLRAHLGVPVIDPVIAAGMVAASILADRGCAEASDRVEADSHGHRECAGI